MDGRVSKKRLTAIEPSPVEGARWVPLSDGTFSIVDEADYPIVMAYSWFPHLRYAQTNYRKDDGTRSAIMLHRFLWRNWGKEACPDIDHIDGDRLNNRSANLRPATRWENSCNQIVKSSNTSGFRGVSYVTRDLAWRASITARQKQYALGYFQDPVAAAKAYDRAALRLHGKFARINFPRSDYED